MLNEIITDKAPKAIGPYSQAIIAGNLVFVSGQIPAVPSTGEITASGISEQCEQVLNNLKGVLEAAGTGLSNVVKTTVFVKNMDDFAVVNEVYARYFNSPYPARSCIEAARLPKGVLVEIEAIAIK